MLKRAAARMYQRRLTMVYNQWMDSVEEIQYARQSMKRVLSRLVSSRLVAAWGSWQELVQRFREQECEAHRQQLVVQRCLMKIKNRAMDTALNAWVEMVKYAIFSSASV